jgi:hypothetical protein
MVNVPFRIYKDNVILADFNKIGDIYSTETLLCGEFRPPLPEYPKYVHFYGLFYVGNSIKLFPSDSEIILNESNQNQILHIIDPGKLFVF